jgi:hypothetical protein
VPVNRDRNDAAVVGDAAICRLLDERELIGRGRLDAALVDA